MNRFIHAVGKKDLRPVKSKKISYLTFYRFAIGIACQRFGIERAQLCQYSRRATDGALVEIEPQPLTIGQRRPIGVQSFRCFARLKHRSTSPAANRHVPATPRLLPAQWLPAQFREYRRANSPDKK